MDLQWFRWFGLASLLNRAKQCSLATPLLLLRPSLSKRITILLFRILLQRRDSNHFVRSLGYEPSEMTNFSTLRYIVNYLIIVMNFRGRGMSLSTIVWDILSVSPNLQRAILWGSATSLFNVPWTRILPGTDSMFNCTPGGTWTPDHLGISRAL